MELPNAAKMRVCCISSPLCISLSLSHLSLSLSFSLPVSSFACCICLRLKSTLKFINDNGQAQPRREKGSGQGEGKRGADRGAQDNGRASDNPVLVVVGGHTNKSLSQYPFVLPFFETRRVELSQVEWRSCCCCCYCCRCSRRIIFFEFTAQ